MESYQTKIIEFPDDYEGKVTATIISLKAKTVSERAILYVHGYIDYFFQDHMAERFTSEGYNFYAIDLRKYGRSILNNQHPYYCRDLNEYFPDIDAAIEEIINEGNKFIAIIGHSTGGLITSLYMDHGKHKDKVDKLILNSPFFEFNASWFKRKIAIPIVALISRIFPYARKKNELSELYADSVHSDFKGEWNYDLKLKPKEGVPLYFAWLGAIRRGQKQIKHGLDITAPVLVMHSAKSVKGDEWNDEFMQGDAVLNVKDINKYSKRLGPDVTIAIIQNGLHDLILSRNEVREKVFTIMLNFLNRQ